MKEDQITQASFMARLITQALCTHSSASEKATLQAWTSEHADNQLLMDELTDPDILHQQLANFRKFKALAGLEKINQRLFGDPEDCTTCSTHSTIP
jgi:hypothetical protein